MDPLSIVASASGVASLVVKLSTDLYLFVDDAKNVDETVQALATELEALRRALDGISTSLAHPKISAAVKAAQTDLDEHLWTSLSQSIDDCQNTCEKFEHTLKKLTKNDGSKMGNFFRQGFKQFKLNFKSNAVVSFRRQITSYTNTMQMALQMIGVVQILQAKEHNHMAHDQLAIKVDLLLGDMQKVTESLKSQDSLATTPLEEDAEAYKHMESVRKSAQRIISSSATILSSGSTVWAGSQLGDREETTGSEFGDGLSPEARFQIEGWIPPSIEEQWEPEPEPTADPEPAPGQKVVRSLTATTAETNVESLFSSLSVSTEATAMSAINEDDCTLHASDTEADVEMEMLRNLLKKGTSLYNQSDFSNAEKYLDRVLKLTEEDKFKTLPDMAKNDINWMIAFSCVMQKNWNAAEDKLKPFALTEEVAEDGTWEDRSVTATLALAEAKLGQDEFDEAARLCLIAVKGRRRIYGSKSEMYYEALALLVRILHSKGDSIAAENYAELLPISSRFHPDTDANALHLLKEGGYNVADDQFDAQECLAWAIQNHHGNVVMLLLKSNKVSPTLTDGDGRTLLHFSAMNGLEDILDYLLSEKKVDPWLEDNRGWTALGDAISKGSVSISRRFIERPDFESYTQSKIQWPPLNFAARFGNTDIMHLLFPFSDINGLDKNGWTPLMSAAHYGQEKAVKLLLEQPGLNPAARTTDGKTALELAKAGSRKDTRAVVRLLKFEKRAVLRTKSELGRDVTRSASPSRSETFSEIRSESSRGSKFGKRRIKELRQIQESEMKKLRERRLEAITKSQVSAE